MSSPDEDDNWRRLLGAGLGGLAVAMAAAAVFSAAQRPAPAGTPPPPPPRAAQPVAAPRPQVPGQLAIGAPVPAFEIERLLGGVARLSELKGRVVVIDFWATWCPPCRAEMPWLVGMAKRLEPKGLTFVAISEDDPPGQVPLVTAFAQEVPGLERFAVLGDPEIESRYGVVSLPTLFVVDRQGNLAARLVGSAREDRVVALVEEVLAR